MKKTVASVAAGAVATFGLAVIAPPAEADHRCVTRGEYSLIEDGQRRRYVARIVNFQEPRRTHRGPHRLLVDYRACGAAVTVTVIYRKRDGVWRVVNKERA